MNCFSSFTLNNHTLEIRREIDEMSASILKSLIYYDLFQYPLTIEEIAQHCSYPSSLSDVQKHTDLLCSEGLIYHSKGFYSLRNDESIFERRIKGNQGAEKIMKKARKRAALIASFPYVRCVCISGSLSKKYFDETSDIDFFVITEPGRLWICRTLLMMFKKIFLLNSKKYFCINYFIDSGSLNIPDQNIFTATEIITLLPMYDYDIYKKFFQENRWIRNYFPNSSPHENGELSRHTNYSLWKKIPEFLLSNRIGVFLDELFQRVTADHWKRKFNQQREEEFEVNMRSRKNVSKHHPQGFQFRVLKLFEEGCRSFEESYQIKLTNG